VQGARFKAQGAGKALKLEPCALTLDDMKQNADKGQ